MRQPEFTHSNAGAATMALSSGDVGCEAEVCRCRKIRGEAQAGTGDPAAVNGSIMAS